MNLAELIEKHPQENILAKSYAKDFLKPWPHQEPYNFYDLSLFVEVGFLAAIHYMKTGELPSQNKE